MDIPHVMGSTGIVRVDHSQFTLGSDEVDTLDMQARGSLLEVGPGFATLFTGVTYGPARVTLRLLEELPGEPGDEWEVVEDTTITAGEPIGVFTLDGEPADGIAPIPPGSYAPLTHTPDTELGLPIGDRQPQQFWKDPGGVTSRRSVHRPRLASCGRTRTGCHRRCGCGSGRCSTC